LDSEGLNDIEDFGEWFVAEESSEEADFHEDVCTFWFVVWLEALTLPIPGFLLGYCDPELPNSLCVLA
jgi:hypothetical protein